jgi:antitoxin (DNA-binding transcriptional repressor) of toxin-antitoxin stability system
MKEISAFEAKNRFGQLLDWVEAESPSRLRGAAKSSPISRRLPGHSARRRLDPPPNGSARVAAA